MKGPPEFRVLGTRVHAVQIPEVIETMRAWIRAREPGRYIVASDMRGPAIAADDPEFARVLEAADRVVPDGMSLVALGRLYGHDRLRRRVYGPELMGEFCRESVPDKTRHFLYGGAPGVARALKACLEAAYPGILIVGTWSPPFRPLTPAEDAEVIAAIRAARPDVIWVGLSLPKQERWMYEHRDRLDVPVMVGVGAAFDLLTGRVRQAPTRMREHGLEWLWRLIQEPRRLWRRTLGLGPRFVVRAALELARHRRSRSRRPEPPVEESWSRL